ncbi:hypothetical protein MNBD_GAMMA12-2664 [hydrothermal vent metagenome]|uniref:Uncharacterized protein n=1 Tax=hydrothermal vent metagenome TaxID=652676 RepID=A0A3B0YKD1_9ZZZZ
MFKKSLTIIWVSVILTPIFYFLALFFLVPAIYDIQWYFTSQSFYQQYFQNTTPPLNTKEIARWSKISGPRSSNGCHSFAGVLLETSLVEKDIQRHVNSIKSRKFSPFLGKLTVSHFYWVDEAIRIQDTFLYPVGVAVLIKKLNSYRRKDIKNYFIVFIGRDFKSSWSMRCH